MKEREVDILNELAKDIYQANKEKGFWDGERNVGEMLMLITSELGEAMEAHRKGKVSSWNEFYQNTTDTFKDNFQKNIKDTFQDEIADAIIRLLDMAGGLGINIGNQIQFKLNYNQEREKLHGKNY